MVALQTQPSTASTNAASPAIRARHASRPSYIVTSRDEQPAVLERTIEELRATTPPWREIVVVDDGSIRPVDLSAPDVTLLRNPAPLGPSASRRIGASTATGDVFVWTDAHMTFAPGWMACILDGVASNALCCTPWRDYSRQRVHSYGADFAWIERRDYANGVRPGFDFVLRPVRPRQRFARIPQIIGACYAMNRRAYSAIGGFCPLFMGHGGDETDMSLRAWLFGAGVRCVRDAEVGHLDRTMLPYPADFADVECNHVVAIRTAFDPPIASLLEQFLRPLPDAVSHRLDTLPLDDWRAQVRQSRRMSEADFLRRLAPLVPIRVTPVPRIRYGHLPAYERTARLDRELDEFVSHARSASRSRPLEAERPGLTLPPDAALLHVAVVAHRGAAIVLGGSTEGRTALALALERRGGAILTLGNALLHVDGAISPWGSADAMPWPRLPVRVVAHVDAVDSAGRPRLHPITAGEAGIALLAAAPGPRTSVLFRAVNAAVKEVRGVQGTRGNASQAATMLLSVFEASASAM